MSALSSDSPGSAVPQPLPRRAPGGWLVHRGARARDAVAQVLLAGGVTPNVLTVAGFAVTCGSAGLLLTGASRVVWESPHAVATRAGWQPFLAALLLVLAGALDILDGAVARNGKLASPFGAVLDSTLDRVSDFAIFAACAVHFALVGNATYVVLSLTALGNAQLISYVKARAENVVERCGDGFWQRPERCGLFIVGAAAGHVPAVLWVLGTLPVLTVVRRVRQAARLAGGHTSRGLTGWPARVMPWRQPRGSIGYGLCALVLAAFVVFGPRVVPALGGAADVLAPLREAVSDRGGGSAARGIERAKMCKELLPARIVAILDIAAEHRRAVGGRAGELNHLLQAADDLIGG